LAWQSRGLLARFADESAIGNFQRHRCAVPRILVE
jgi:hypothetical protein